jgi:TolA-binding protein
MHRVVTRTVRFAAKHWTAARELAWVLACASVCALTASCAYYNIFWTAEREYEKATAGTAFADFSNPYAQQKPTGENLKNVESCLRRCGKILLLYPKSKWVDDSLVLMGNCFLLKGEYANALRKYEELLRFYPSSEFADEARYMKAYTYALEGSAEEALLLLESQAGQAGTKQWQERSAVLRARIYENKGDCAQVITLLEDYLNQFPGGREAHEARLALGECLIRAGRQSDAIGVLEPLVGRQDDAGAAASVRLGRAYRELGQPEKAIEVLDGLFKTATVDSFRARAEIEKALTLDGQGKYQEAIDVLSVADSVGQAALGPEAKYRTGLIYEKGLGDFEKATTVYDAASKGTSNFSRAASKRATALKSVGTHRKALLDSAATAASLAANRFALAETYLLDLDMPTLAEEQYRVLSDSLPTNDFTARSMLVLGSLLDARGDSTAAGYYQAVIDSFPNTIQANIARAWFSLPLVDIVVAPADTAFVGPEAMGPGIGDSLAVDAASTDSLSARVPWVEYGPESGTMVGPEKPPADSLGGRPPRVRSRPPVGKPAQPPAEEQSPKSTDESGDEPLLPVSPLGPWDDQGADTSGSQADTLGSPHGSTLAPQSDRGDR